MTTKIDDNNADVNRTQDSSVAQIERYYFTIPEASYYSGIGINRMRAICALQRCPFVYRIGNRTLVKRKAFEKWLDDAVEI